MILIDLTDEHIQMLLKCKNTKKTMFKDWSINGLINRAIYDFYNKHGKETKKQ